MQDAIDRLADYNAPPDALTLSQIISHAEAEFALFLKDRKNAKRVSYRLEACGYVAVRNNDAKDGLWKLREGRKVIYASAALSVHKRIVAAKKLAADLGGNG
jgi:hypothetical protein